MQTQLIVPGLPTPPVCFGEVGKAPGEQGCHYCSVGDRPEWLADGWFHCNGASVQARCTARTA